MQNLANRCAALSAAALSSVVLLALAAPLPAQTAYVGAGTTFPTGDYDDFVKTGFLGTAGVTYPLGAGGLDVVAEAFAGVNHAENSLGANGVIVDGNNVALYGAMAGLLLDLAPEGQPGFYLFGQGGAMVHDPEEYGTETGLAMAAGAGYGLVVSGVDVWAEGRYMRGQFDNGDISVMGLLIGAVFPLGGG